MNNNIVSFEWEFTDRYGSKLWLVVGRHNHWWNVNIDTTSIYGERILTSGCDIADTDYILLELKMFGCKYTNEQYQTLVNLGKKRLEQLSRIRHSKEIS